MPDPTERFTNRVEHYARSRPSYPAALLDVLAEEIGLRPEHVVADLGAGTGQLARLFLAHGNRVIAVEPNDAMRARCDRELGANARYSSVDGRAERTTLPDHGVDLAVAGQAFHWFDAPHVRPELLRILRPGGWVALVWNLRPAKSNPWMTAYEAFVRRFGTDYERVRRTYADEAAIGALLGPDGFRRRILDNRQELDFDGLRSRVLSSSYMPAAGHPRHEEMLAALRLLFDAHQVDGTVALDYETPVYVGRPGSEEAAS